jgi:opacity protein-like surface antigen
MKKICTLILLALCCGTGVSAQQIKPLTPELPRHEIHVKYGVLSVPTLLVLTEHLFTTAFTGGYSRIEHFRSTGALNLGYQYRLNRYFALTADGAYQKITSDVYYGNQPNTEQQTATFITLMGGFKFYYLEHEKVRLYLQVAAGLSELEETGISAGTPYTDYHQLIAFHLNPIGIQLGKKLAVDLEVLSAGYLGTLNIGASYRF